MQNRMIEMYQAARKYAKKYGPIGVNDYEDIAQAAMMRLIAQAEMPLSRVWMFKTVRSVAFDVGRRVRREENRKCSYVPEVVELVADDSHNQPEIDLLPRLNNMIGEMSPILRDALLLYAEGYTYEEIAARLKVKTATVRTRIHYARKDARKRWTEDVS